MTNNVEHQFREIARNIREGKLDLGRRVYALALAHSFYQTLLCGYSKITVVELGVATGNGLLDLCCAAEYYSRKFNIAVDIFGFDTGSGLPSIQDFRDHPEIWKSGDYSLGRVNLQNQLPVYYNHVFLHDVLLGMHLCFFER